MCCVRCVPPQPRAAWPTGLGRGGAGSLRRWARPERRCGRPSTPAQPWPVTRSAPPTRGQSRCLLSQQLTHSPAHSPARSPPLSPRRLLPRHPPKAAGPGQGNSTFARAPRLLPTGLRRPQWGGAGRAVPKGTEGGEATNFSPETK